jgi:hypothetical protein
MPCRVLVAVLVIVSMRKAGAQDADLQALLDRLGTYLVAYEEVLSAVVAEETYQQRTTRRGPRPRVDMDSTGQPLESPRPTLSETRRLQSTVSFMRLPGGAAWLGIREVRMIDGRTLVPAETLTAILTSRAGDARAQAAALALANAQHNLGNPRSVNMPTLPLALLDPHNRDRMTFRLAGRDSIRGRRTTKVAFEEKGAPTLITGGAPGHWVISRGLVWIEDLTGAVWRAQVLYRDYLPGVERRAPEAEVHVDFVRHAALGMLVPERMREIFQLEGGRGEGEASYSNYRRFTTSGRIIPPPS